MIRHIVTTCFIVLCPALAFADNVDAQHFESWLTVSDLLRSENVDPTRPSWLLIERMCLPLKEESNEIEYTRCRYEKALMEYQFNTNSNACSQDVADEYPDSLLDEYTTRTYTKKDSSGKTITIEERVKYYNSRKNLLANRRKAYKDCMQSYDWQNVRDWRAGKNSKTAE